MKSRSIAVNLQEANDRNNKEASAKEENGSRERF